ncbi:MAG: class I SAM-dependent methyltransferase [Myxococcales bacterium]|nr:class I SAM-dependent methyltransferase [Myxococcales bacterium]
MPANFTRRRDLLAEAGVPEPDAALSELTREVSALGLPAEWSTTPPPSGLGAVREALSTRLFRVPAEQRRLARLVPEWIIKRSGDLASALWLPLAEHGAALDLSGYLLAILGALADEGRERESQAYARFMLDLQFDWRRMYADPRLAYGFMREREPNPLVWRLLEELRPRGLRLGVLELGCGIGNDALGLLGSELVDSYTGIDISERALEAFEKRVARERPRVPPRLIRSDFLELLERLTVPEAEANLVYSYSSLHYFSSGELRRILQLVHRLLRSRQSGQAFFCFGIKGAGSVWDGQGLPLYRPDVWINWDGQSRWFPTRGALAHQLDEAGYEIRFHELHDHWGYSELGRRDVFHYVLCSPRRV